jgi:hypothetical protein
MLGEAIAAGTVIAAGQLADQLGNRRLRLIALQFLRSARDLNWRRFVSHQAWRTYTSIYGRKSSSLRFQVRSAVIYVTLFATSLAFLYAVFPETYLTVTSAFRYGNYFHVFGWCAAAILGVTFYNVAAAQTLYFLEILKSAPSVFRFFLVAYADVLITSSIALFGVPLLMLVMTGFSLMGSQADVNITFEFKQNVRSPSLDLLTSYRAKLSSADVDQLIKTQDKLFYLEAGFSVEPTDWRMYRKDFELTKSYILREKPKNLEYNENLQAIRTIEESGSVYGFRNYHAGFEDRVSTIEIMEGNQTVEERRLAFCRQFSSGRQADYPYVTFAFHGEQKSRLLEACIKQGSVTLTLPVRYNTDNVDLGSTYKLFLVGNLADLLRALGSGFQTYFAVSPYRMLDPKLEGGGWWHVHRIGEQEDRTYVALDEALSSALFAELGGYNSFLNYAFAAGTVNFVIMSTAVFNLFVIGFLIIFYPAYYAARNFGRISRFSHLRRYPFTLISLVASGYLLLLQAAFL